MLPLPDEFTEFLLFGSAVIAGLRFGLQPGLEPVKKGLIGFETGEALNRRHEHGWLADVVIGQVLPFVKVFRHFAYLLHFGFGIERLLGRSLGLNRGR